MSRAASPARSAPVIRSVNLMAWCAAVATFVMISAGSMVTTMDAGDSVPDWPLSYGQVLPPMVGNVFYEHGHRMIGWALGLLTIVMTIVLFLKEPRRWVRNLGLLVLIGVCLQGALGGLRVLVVSNPDVQDAVMTFLGAGDDVGRVRRGLSMIHAATAQALFAIMVTLAVVTSRGWWAFCREQVSEHAGRLRTLSVLTLAIIYLQLGLGAFVRQTGSVTGLIIHIVGALAVMGHTLGLALRLMRNHGEVPWLRRPAVLLLVLVLLQIGLGVGAWASTFLVHDPNNPTWIQAAARSGHLVLGSLILATVMTLTLRLYRTFLVPATRSEGATPVPEGANS